MSGEDQQKKSKKLEEKQINLTKTETRARQGSCMIDQIDKDLVKILINKSCLQISKTTVGLAFESASLICLISYKK